ncbi:glucans biosynthesis glucosyltransferase MdoH [Catenovulum sp. 2E275]|uniref:glucans biosynthesis glucosyltransferase MdoH n=1 Tax=Catenovulum sp. 2E275 TaxID=2980497 RepID=UPI0021CFCE0E|nr:glucans biosynthesis glucosyltransferase MdoH [Catenovulum sp. 2E275]MCU4674702.1 glucans biosynthesis glucosyltransferase MdoH [Catenovulum sp. 2E275]
MFGIPMTHHNKIAEQVGGQIRFKLARKLLFVSLVIATAVYGIWIMFDILSSNGTTGLEFTLLVLFGITFSWIVSAFWSGALGFILQLFKLDPLTLKRQVKPNFNPMAVSSKHKTAVVMPIYNEDTKRVIGGFEACIRSLAQLNKLHNFDFYLLSDTQDSTIATAERNAWGGLCERLGELSEHVFYRRRSDNKSRKVGNLTDFCERWGSQYEHMIVLDADSVMTGECMLNLVNAMEQNPQAGLIQTVPIPVRQQTFFGRFLQFAAQLYSPMLATGLAFWQTDGANYWGHNAIIRTKAFMQNCGLPELTGKGAFGGEILSHDFVEAALLYRSGWQVILLADLEGSYEEVPSNILDYAVRDRRWVQGNIQHLALLPAKKLKWMNKFHFLLGAVAYISSLIWLSMLLLSSIDAVARALTSNVFFEQAYQLFPTWKIAKTELIYSLLFLTSGLLLLPKVMGLIIALVHRRAEFGGVFKLIFGFVIETIFAIVIAPMMMVFHAYFVVCVFIGRKVSWDAQAREGRMVPWKEAFNYTLMATLIAAVWGGITYYYAPVFFWWMTPVLFGLVIAAPIIRYSSSLRLGRLCYRMGIFISPSETAEDAVLVDLKHKLDKLPEQFSYVHPDPQLPPEYKGCMPIQSFNSTKKIVEPALT